MRRRLIAGNWKMNSTIREAGDLAAEVRLCLDSTEGIDVVLCPSVHSVSRGRRAVKRLTNRGWGTEPALRS